MNHDGHAVTRQMDVAFEPSTPSGRAWSNAAERVLRTQRCAAAVRDGDDAIEREQILDDVMRVVLSYGSRVTSLWARCAKRSVPVASRIDPSRTSCARISSPASGRAARCFPGIIGYDDTVVPQVVNAVLSKHNFILLGLRGQAKTRLLRALVELLDRGDPGRARLRDPRRPAAAAVRRVPRARGVEGDDLPIAWLARERRYVEKLATPDVTIADLIGDVDPIKAARAGRELGDELVMHYGLLPRANRGLFAINELPDLASKVQVGLFNILQEGDVQIKGFPVRLRLDVALMFSANPEDYTARGKIITPLKDRIGSEIRTHYPRTRDEAMAITAQEAWTARDGRGGSKLPVEVRHSCAKSSKRSRSRREAIRRSTGGQASASACRSPRSRASCPTPSGGRWCTARRLAVPRVSDIYASLPSITGKIELEYEGELKGAEHVARELIRAAVATCVRRARLPPRHAPDRDVVRERRHPRPVRHIVGRDGCSMPLAASTGSMRRCGAGRTARRSTRRSARRSRTSSSKASAP